MQLLIEHSGCDQGVPAIGDTEAPGAVFFQVNSDLSSLGNLATTIDNSPTDMAMILDLAFRQDQGVFYESV